MAISYNVYANDGLGGDVDYSSPIATTTGLGFTTGALAAPSDNTFAVRAFNPTSGIEEANTDARVRIVLDPAGIDVTARPNDVRGLSASPTAGGSCWITWGYDPAGQGGPPTQFAVTITPGPPGPALLVDYLPGASGYGCSLPGLADNTTYAILVRAVGASALLTSLGASVSLDYRVNLLSNVDSLTAASTP